jgi:hypothetical protein
VEYLFLIILIGALGVGLVVLTWLGLAQRRRRRLLARAAHQMGMKFSPADLFDLTRRYGGFVLASAGHSRRAENVLYGRYAGWPLRAFDFCFEAGHGPRRLARRYSVIVADTDLDLPPALMWHASDDEHPPLAARRSTGQIGAWRVVEGETFAPRLAEAFNSFAEDPMNIQTLGRSVILSLATRWEPRALPERIRKAVAALEALRERCATA